MLRRNRRTPRRCRDCQGPIVFETADHSNSIGLGVRVTLGRARSAFTLLEMVVVVAIIGILMTLLLPALGPIRDRIERVVCMGNLRSIYGCLSSYLTDNEQWPQCPANSSRTASETFWITTLQDYGARRDVWICPTLKRSLSLAASQGEDVPKIHYIPAQFDDKAATPHKWPGMPWAIEMGDMHKCGALLIRSDGAIKTMNDIFTEASQGTSVNGVTVQKLN